MHETYEFLPLGDERLFVGLHHPVASPNQAIVMCYPVGEEKLWAHRVFVSCARDLAAAGFLAVRFDFRGEGDSDRSFENSDFESRIEDVCCAIDAVHRLYPGIADVTLLGLRLGAGVAAAAAARRGDVARLILWDPVTDGTAYMQAVLRINLMYQMAQHHKVVENRDALVARLSVGETVNIEGYELGERFFRQVGEFRLEEALSRFQGVALLVQVNQADADLKPELAGLAQRYGRCHAVAVKEEPFWKEIKTFCQRAPELTRVTLDALGVAS